MAPSLDQIIASPDHYLHSFEGDQAIFVPMDPAAYRRSIFLDRRISSAGEGYSAVSADALIAAAPPPQRAGWIFHIAHCGSTLVARAWEQMDDGLVLREPLSLRQLALDPHPDRLKVTHALVTRRYSEASMTVIKANVPVNFLLPGIVRLDPDAPCICLYNSLADYLMAILRSDNHRAWLRNITGLLSAHLGDTARFSDAELGATLWIAQMRQFAHVFVHMPHAQSLNAEHFFAEPAATLNAAATLFGKDIERAQLDEIVSGPLFKSYSKNPDVAFDNAARIARQKEVFGMIGDEIKTAEAWIAKNAPDASAVLKQIQAAALGR